MLTVDEFGQIRRAHRDGMSIREIARRFRHSRRTIRKVLAGDGEPKPYSARKQQAAPKLGAFHDLIREILAADELAPPKQRHTAMRIFERLRDDHGYVGQYDAVRRFVKKHRTDKRETFIPLSHAAGQRVECDFGQMHVDFPDGRRAVSVLIVVWSYSNAPFAIALPTQRTEAILEGMSQAFAFFGCVPREVWWDNPKTVATAILSGRERKMNPRYAALASHFAFEPLFCMPVSGNEKSTVENRVKTMQRRWGTPVLRAKSPDDLNTQLLAKCVADRSRVSPDKTKTIGERFEEDKRAAGSLSQHGFDTCVRQPAKVNKYQFVRFDNVSYSVPRSAAFKTVTVKGYVDRVEIVEGVTVVATHIRSYESGDQVFDPRHYLTTLGRRPAALEHSDVYKNWHLPPVFKDLRARLEERYGPKSGVRQYVRVLQLLGEHPLERVAGAIEQLRGAQGASADRIIRRVTESAQREESSPTDDLSNSVRSEVMCVSVPPPRLTHFDAFLNLSSPSDDDQLREESDDQSENNKNHRQQHGERRRVASAQHESETAEAADDQVGVREAGAGSEFIEPDVRAISAQTHGTGSGNASVERPCVTHSHGELSGGEGSGHVRFQSSSVAQQAENSGALA